MNQSEEFKTRAQIFQDSFVLDLYQPNIAQEILIDFGAAHPTRYSNSSLLIDKLKFTGYLIEPNAEFYDLLSTHYYQNEKVVIENIAISEKCESGVNFDNLSYLSRISKPNQVEDHASDFGYNKKKSTQSQVRTHCPEHFLNTLGISGAIWFLSIDTEGSEFEILSNWPFEKCKPLVITVETNFSFNREESIRDLLKQFGYRNVLRAFSSMDLFFVHESISNI
jgi:FkbM family methyltransferase